MPVRAEALMTVFAVAVDAARGVGVGGSGDVGGSGVVDGDGDVLPDLASEGLVSGVHGGRP